MDEADPFEVRITKAAYAAEDVIESNIVENIRLAAQKSLDKTISSTIFLHDLQKVIKEMDLIKKEAVEITPEKAGVHHLQQQRKPNVSETDTSSLTRLNNDTMVGFEELLIEIMDKLTLGGNARRIIPIVGMGGIGKTTLARNVFAHPLVKEHFDVCVWVTISQQFNANDILLEVISHAKKESRKQFENMSEDEVQLAVYQYLSHRRFIIVMDDMWSIDPWNKIGRFFPDNNNGSRIVVTTRISQLGSQLGNNNGTEMKFLGEDSTWTLFSKTVFGEESFMHELEETGNKIVESCKGLPLSIVVIGGLLKKLERTRECWESIGKNLNSVLNLEGDEYCLNVLRTSYIHLPVHLKPCFLYMGVFEEDREIHVSTLLWLWISESFIKQVSGKSLEITAEEYLMDLVGRNLLLVHKVKSNGNIKYCKIHDLLREFCLREAQKEKFYSVIEPNSCPVLYDERRIVIPESTSEEILADALQSMPRARSLICDNEDVQLKPNFGLLRLLHGFNTSMYLTRYDKNLLADMFQLVNLKYLAVGIDYKSQFPSSINLMWNLQTLIVDNPRELNAPIEIWKMSQLRHVHFFRGLHLPVPPNDTVIMEDLQSLRMLSSLKCTKEVVKRIPNIKKLSVKYDKGERMRPCFNNLESQLKLESFWYFFYPEGSVGYQPNFTFPQSLQKLTLFTEILNYENLLEKIGSLPLLRKLVLIGGLFKTHKWETVEGQFRSLRFLRLE